MTRQKPVEKPMKIIILAAAVATAMPALAQEMAAAPDIGPPYVAPLEDSIAPLDTKAPADDTSTEAPVSASAPAPADPSPLLVCSKKITDHCVQRGAFLRLMRKNKLLPAGNH
jgi:hypothetical protein